MNPYTRFEQDFNEQLAGIVPPEQIPQPQKSKDAEPIRVWADHDGAEL